MHLDHLHGRTGGYSNACLARDVAGRLVLDGVRRLPLPV